MGEFATWKLVIDILLLASLTFLCLRFLKATRAGTSTRELIELETTLKRLIREAERGGQSLSEALTKRQDGLQKLLFEIETVEGRVNRAIEDSETRKKALSAEMSRAKVLAETLVRDVQPERSEPKKTPESFARANTRQEQSDVVPTNIFGEPIGTASSLDQEPTSNGDTLVASIEKEVLSPAKPRRDASMVKIYEAAEQMLLAGIDVGRIATLTKIPIDELRKLSQTIRKAEPLHEETPEEYNEAAKVDARLGVLGPIRREARVL